MKTIIFLLLLTSGFTASAQNSEINGSVLDAATKVPVEYATISLFPQGSKQPVTGTISDEKGNFTLLLVKSGEYHISVNFMGYQQ